ncbi:unnamed protein product [Macrosiphum euphorbiae]|uniref:Uncharacterized protein n=1 Tax=Macrosiphum euphorbiae TaxID=13131 RepID=A0AAV0X3F2_9HEMI|nr:unnamed protein product [Macrosiphum euphorbiae]
MPTNPDPNELRKWKRKIDTLCAIIEDHFAFASQYTSESNNISQVKVRLEEINEFSEKFEEYQAELEMLDEKKDSEWINVRRSFRNRLCDVKAALLKIIDDHVIHPDNVSSPSMSSARSQQHLNTFNSMRYPPCALPTFSGDWQQWSSFIDTFNSMFHNEHSNLPLVQRFHYLRSCLAGQASDVIKSIPTTAEHFQYAYDLLVNRYENKSAIIQSHIRSLLETPKVVSPSCSELQKLHHHVTSNINALKSLQQPVEQWDAWLVTLLCSKMDSATVGEWYLQYKSKDLPSYVAVEQFLANRITAYEAGDMNCLSSEPRKMSTKSSNNKTYEKKALFVKSKEKGFGKCPLCTEHHKLYACSKFNNMSTNDRRNFVMKSRLCFNCLNFGHQVSSCYFPPCPRCGEKHNSKLHEEQANTNNQDASIANDVDSPEPHATAMYTEISAQETENLNVILATAIVNVCDTFGRMHSCRAVLDSGSQLNFITNSCAKRLNLSTASHTLNIVGVSAMASTAKQLQDTIMTSRFGDFKTTIKFYSLQTIVSALPSQVLIRDNLKMPHNILNQLADPNFHSPGPIDVLLGADIFFDVLYGEKFPLSNLACLHRTKLGWIVTGKISTLSTPHTLPNLMIQNQSALSFFTSKTNQRILEEFKAEEHFQSTFRRHCSGRFIVKLPMAQDPKVLGDSLDMAQKRFLNLERRLQKDKVLTEHLPHNQKDPNFMINLTETEVLSALGLLWQPSIDSFRFAMKNWNAPQHISKRTLLSNINSVYDPLGLLSSVLIKGKIFIQQVWSLKVGWDDILSEEIRSKWLKFYSSLVALNGLIIPRLALLPESDSYELHGFCDASQHAYGACIYIRSSKQDGDAEVKLFTARSRVAPIKTTTIPRLELCGALLLSELVNEIKDEFSNINIKLSTENIHLWTDSTIVLPSKSLITKLIFNYEHIRLMHAGPQALLAHVTLNYWPIRGRQIAAQIVRKCVTCFRASPQFTPPLMAPLPSATVNSNKVHDFLTMREIKWHFIPPASPHFGGLWESAVKSAKKHLLRVSKGVLLTFDETRTLLCQIEAALNSRPLSPLSLDPNDFNALTPGHFLIGGPLMLPPEPDVSSIPQNRLKRYSLMRQQMQLFWKRWSQEYLPQLHRRGKWTKPNRNFCVGDLAVLRDDNMPPFKWPLVRVAAVHPGADGVVRAVTVRNSTGSEFRRPAIKLSLLPTEKDHDDED